MDKIVFGLESECGFTPFDHSGNILDRRHYADLLVRLASSRYATLAGYNRQDLFLSSGHRVYVDAGLGLINLECSTPECRSPQALIAHKCAGDRILAGLARELEATCPELHRFFIFKTNFDYCGHTSGSHENYRHDGPQAFIGPQLIPHLVTRGVYSGGGGFCDSSAVVSFMLSPRAAFLQHVTSEGAQDNRGIYTIRYEPLGHSGCGRLHLLCGEGVRYDMTEYLRFGVTALIICLIDAGFDLSKGIELDPLPAINKVARDVLCQEEIGLINGCPATAIDVQRHYLAQVEAQVGGSLLPDWSALCCQRWRKILDGRESNPLELAGIVDWPTKLSLYRAFVESEGFDWEQLTNEVDDSFAEIRSSLFEFDISFGDIAEDGIFAEFEALDKSDNRVVDEQQIETAMRTPPQDSRARLRGKWIERLSPRFESIRCSWEGIHDHQNGRWLRFDDPLGQQEVSWESA